MTDFFSHVLESRESTQRDARMNGLVFAEVSRITDDGTFELRFLSHDSTEPSAPARLASLMAGDQRGAFFRPEVGDEVVVGFELGDIDRPVILGALWSDRDQVPQGADTGQSNNTRMIVSRLGHQILLDDTSGSGKVQVKTAGGHELTLDDASGAAKIHLKSTGGLEIIIEDTPPKITIKSTGTVATSRIELDGVSWNHQHATGTGPSGPPVSIAP